MTDTLGRREAIARIIDPYAWDRRDEFAAILRGEGLSPDPSLAEMQKRSAARRIDAVVADSLAKADAILALSLPAREGSGERARARAQLAAWHAIYGPQADPFANPEAYDFCAGVADAVLATTPAPREKLEADLVEAVKALRSAREALHQHYVDWDGEPEDAVALQLARSECDAALAKLDRSA